jgi:hypothetical protein
MAALKYITIPSYPGIQDKPATTFQLTDVKLLTDVVGRHSEAKPLDWVRWRIFAMANSIGEDEDHR